MTVAELLNKMAMLDPMKDVVLSNGSTTDPENAMCVEVKETEGTVILVMANAEF